MKLLTILFLAVLIILGASDDGQQS